MSSPDAILARLSDLHPKKIDLSLGRMERLLAKLGHPERRLPPVVHVAGTNGKGSTVAYLRAIHEAAGKKVHAYISPHLVRFNERIRIAGQLIEDQELFDLLSEVERINDGDPITFFEITNAAAFLAFSRHDADVCLLETGLGGRLDSTNVIARPALCVITPVSFDHPEFLGRTLAEIADAKAGILKPDVPAVIGPQPAEAMAVIEAEAIRQKLPLWRWGREWRAMPELRRILFQQGPASERGISPFAVVDRYPMPSLPGLHQIQNAGAAIMASRLLSVPDAAIAAGLKSAVWPARMQHLAQGRLIRLLPPGCELWLDGGHNEAAAQAIAAAFSGDDRPLVLVIGMLKTKDLTAFLQAFSSLKPIVLATPIAGEDNGRPPGEIVAAARDLGLDARPFDDLAAALSAVRIPDARVLICGSLYLAGRVLAENGTLPD